MEAFVKAFATYRTIKKATVIASSLVVDSLDAETSTVTVVGTEIGQSHTGNWLIIDGSVFSISNVKPQNDRTLLTLVSPLDVFSRLLELDEQPDGQTNGGFIADQLQRGWVEEADPVYAMPYLAIVCTDSTAFQPPELDGSGCFKLPDYCRLMRKSYRTTVRFTDSGNNLVCTISRPSAAARNVSFEDSRSKLQSVDFSSSGTAKLTVLRDVDTGEKDANGEAIMARERYTWYLAEDGSVSQNIPARRASGIWGTISIKEKDDMQAKVVEAFAKNKANHKLEFWSSRDLSVQDDCTFQVYGDTLKSYISYKRKTSEDSRWYYKSGELATTASEKLRGAIK